MLSGCLCFGLCVNRAPIFASGTPPDNEGFFTPLVLKEIRAAVTLSRNHTSIIDVRLFGDVIKGVMFFTNLLADWSSGSRAMALAFALGIVAFTAQGDEGPPVIVIEPVGQSVVTGDTVTFEVEAIGAAPLRYQWRQNGTNLPGSTNASLVITNAQPRHWGNYTVVITNAFGAVTSSVATIIVDADLVFHILALQTNSAVAVEHSSITGDDRGGIAVSADNVFVTGDGSGAVVTGRFPFD